MRYATGGNMSNKLVAEYPLLASVILAIALSVWVMPKESSIAGHRWGRHVLSLVVFVTTIANAWRFFSAPHGSDAAINAFAVWVFQTLFLGGIGYAIGRLAFKLFGKYVPQTSVPAIQPTAVTQAAALPSGSEYTKMDIIMIGVILFVALGAISLFLFWPR